MTAGTRVEMDGASVADLRRAPAFGLHAVAELGRIQNAIGLLELSGQTVPEALHPVTNGHEVISDFAGALLWLDTTTPVGAQP